MGSSVTRFSRKLLRETYGRDAQLSENPRVCPSGKYLRSHLGNGKVVDQLFSEVIYLQIIFLES